MGNIVFNMSVSLDGFVAGPNDEVDQLFRWYGEGDTAFQYPGTDSVFNVSGVSARLMQHYTQTIGAIVTGRRNFDVSRAWGGQPPLGLPHVVVTHHPPPEWDRQGSPFTFITDGVASAIKKAKQAAGAKDVAISSANILQQCLQAGLVDEIHLDLVPIVLGNGIRLFDNPGRAAASLTVTGVVAGTGVTHLHYAVIR